MIDLSRPWPLGIGTKAWWQAALVALVALVVAAAFDVPLSQWARGWPDDVQRLMEQITNLGLSDWILIPSAFFFVVTAALALITKWRLMRTLLWQFTVLYAFIFAGVGVPSLATTLVKRLVGRGRPVHLADTGPFGLHPNLFDWTYQSFPSGHATTIFSAAMVVGFTSPRLFYPALLVAVAVGVSRVAVGAHYPSDVVAGAIMGVLGAYAVRWEFARRGWMFVTDPAGGIRQRVMAALTRYMRLKRRGNAPAPPPDRP